MFDLNTIETVIAWAFLAYMLITSGVYLILNMIAFETLQQYMQTHRSEDDELLYTGIEPPITIIVPSYNEEETIVTSIRSLLQLHYPSVELIIVNDGSRDNTLDVLITAFNFEPFPEAYRARLKTKPIRNVYLSRSINNLRLIDKENGGKSDSLNAGLNISRCPLFCCVDADSILEKFSLIRAVQPFIENPDTVACGGTVRIANGCKVRYGNIIKKGLPTNPLAILQLIEYLRGFLFGRIGWSRVNGLLIISGAFGLLHKESVIEAGGYRTDTVGEDMELIVRLHKMLTKKNQPYKISFIPDPVCWTEVPEKISVFASQRTRWHRGLSESLWLNRELAFSRHSGVPGWLAFPFFVLFEWLSPFIELAGYIFTVYLISMQKIDLPVAVIIFLFAVILSVFLSTIAVFLDEITFPGIFRLHHIFVLFLFSILECFGYRQINAYFRMKGALSWLLKTNVSWGNMIRSGKWQQS